MKAHTSGFKDAIKLHGREIASKITYTLNGETIELGNEELNSITPHYEGNILKSVMKQLDIDSNIDIPIGTIVNYQFGLKVGNSYEYLNFGNYIIYSSEKREDTNSFKIIAYDKMLYSMVDYSSVGITYPITIRNYIKALSTYLGLAFKNENETFPNYDKEIQQELYLSYNQQRQEWDSLDYTFRDVFDELSQVTAGTICINNNDQLEIRYVTPTNDTIDEEFLKDTNVGFEKKYGKINSIVLSRSAESDNVYLRDEQSVLDNGLCEIKIVDNQIMNWNDRSDYLPDILGKLDGLEYQLNDFTSTGIMYYDLCDRYDVQVGEKTYSCVMFNDDIFVTQGLFENIHTDMPEESQTDYTKADKTDRKLNQTYLIVDKQNQKIESVITNVGVQDQKIARITQTVDDLTAQISDIADLTISGESNYATLDLDRIQESEPIMIKIRPTANNIAYLYPSETLYPSDNLFMPLRSIRFYNETNDTYVDYELPDNLLYYDSEHYDEFYLDYESQTCHITKRCKYNADGSVGLLSAEVVNSYPYPYIPLDDGNYTVSIYGYSYGYIFARLMSQNIYTSQFYTKAEVNSIINQTATGIDLSVDQKLSNYSTTTQMNSAITLKANEINSSVSETYTTKTESNQLSSRINQTAKTISLSVSDNQTSAGLNIKLYNENGTEIDDESANITLSGLVKFTDLSTSGSTTINGANIQTGTLSASQITTGTLNGNNVSITNLNASNIKAGTLNGNNVSITNLSASNIKSGTLNSTNVKIGGWNINSTGILSNDAQIFPTQLGYKTDGTGGWVSCLWWKIGKAGTLISDKRYKKDIKKLEESYNKFFDELKPISFKWKDKNMGERTNIGFIAQDIQKAEEDNNLDLEMLIDDGESLNLDRRDIIALNTWQIQMLKQQVKMQQEQIDLLKEEINKLKGGK